MPRGSRKGEHRGGRKPGTPNRDKKALQDLMDEQFPGYHPVIQMAGIAQDETVEIGHRISCMKEVAQYLYPKRKAVDHTADNQIVIMVSEKDMQLR